jgi:hypothetical protein
LDNYNFLLAILWFCEDIHHSSILKLAIEKAIQKFTNANLSSKLAIAKGTLLAVADGSYIRKQHPDLCTAAFILECTRHWGMLVGLFPDASKVANAFQGELLGLMAIHLLLLAVNTVSPELAGRVKIYSDCLGSLGRIADLPPYRIPTRCIHSNVLKTILVTRGGLSFHREYIYVKAYQDDLKQWEDLLREAQLNAACDAGAKAMLRLQDITDLPQQEPFPLEPLCMFVEGTKMTSDTWAHIRYVADRQVARTFFHETFRMFTDAFDKVDWPQVHWTLNEEVPLLFQVWESKQVMIWPQQIKICFGDTVMDGVINVHAVQYMWRRQHTSSSAQRRVGWKSSCSRCYSWNGGYTKSIQTQSLLIVL